MINVFAQTKINLNLAKSSGGVTPKEIGKVFLNRRIDGSHRIHPPAAWLSNLRSLAAKGRDQIKGRNFEIPGSGGFLLTSLTDDLPEYYVPGREVAAYTDFDDLADKVRYYLAHDQEREAIRRAGYERTLREHTYVHRFSAIFSTMFPHGLPESRAQATHGAGEN
jgi:spore maturation protein CgeB